MDDDMVTKAKTHLLKNLEPYQAVIMVTHWEEEVPWSTSVVRRMQLKNGTCTEA